MPPIRLGFLTLVLACSPRIERFSTQPQVNPTLTLSPEVAIRGTTAVAVKGAPNGAKVTVTIAGRALPIAGAGTFFVGDGIPAGIVAVTLANQVTQDQTDMAVSRDGVLVRVPTASANSFAESAASVSFVPWAQTRAGQHGLALATSTAYAQTFSRSDAPSIRSVHAFRVDFFLRVADAATCPRSERIVREPATQFFRGAVGNHSTICGRRCAGSHDPGGVELSLGALESLRPRVRSPAIETGQCAAIFWV